MKSLASISEKDIETIQMALNDSISDINVELKGTVSDRKKLGLLDYKEKYSRVLKKLRQNPSIYALAEFELDFVAGGLHDAVEMLEECLEDDLTEEEKSDIMVDKNDFQRLLDILVS